MNHKYYRIIFVLLTTIILSAVIPVSAAPKPMALNFNDADIRAVITGIGRILHRNFVIDPAVKGKVTIISNRAMSNDDVYKSLLTILKVHGYTTIDNGGITVIAPMARSLQFDVPVRSDKTAGLVKHAGLITRIHVLRYIEADKAVAVLQPMLTTKGQISTLKKGNIIIITAPAVTVKRLLTIIGYIDTDNHELSTVTLEYADARQAAAIIERLELKSGRIRPSQLQLAVDERTNAIIISGDPDIVLRVKAVIGRLDTPIKKDNSTQVVFLHYAKAKDLAAILNKMRIQNPAAAATKSGQKNTEAPAQVQADEGTNALLITAPPTVMKTLRSVIMQLDIRRAQVMIEAIIAEVSTNKAAELGVQWQATANTGPDSSGVVGGTNFNGTGNGITQLSVNPLSVGSGLSLGYFRGTTSILGTDVLNLGVLLRALTSDNDTNILSTPSLVTLDNEEAEIVVGQNVPFVTGSYTSTGSSTLPTNPFQTIARRDIGIKLKVKPQINEGNTIRLDIEQEVSNLTNEANEGGTITNNRSIKTSVIIENNKVLVLGGLISDDVQEGIAKVPILGSIPILGLLFRYKNSKHVKRNLMVFIKPQIIRNEPTGSAITFDKYDAMRRQQQQSGAGGIILMPSDKSPVLPEQQNQ